MRPIPYLLIILALLLASCGEQAPKSDNRTVINTLDTPAPPTEAERIEHGKYLVGIMGCHDCHSPKKMGPNGPELDADRLLSGFQAGTTLPPMPKDNQGWALMAMDLTAAVGPWGTSYAANLTSDESGIGSWTEEQFVRALTKGLYKGIEGSRPLLPPMPWQNLVHAKPEDLKDIFMYLKSTRPVNNVVPAPLPPTAPARTP